MANSVQQRATPEQMAANNNAEYFHNNQSVEEIIADSQRNQAYLSVEQRTKAESQNLANSINGNEQQQLAKDVDLLLGKYQDLVKGISSAEGSGKTKRELKHRLNENIESLKRIKKDLEKHNYNNLATYRARVSELTYYFEHYEQVRQIVVLGGRTSDIHAIIDSKQDARYARRQENKDAKYQSSMNDILHEAALTSLWNDDMERYEEYLEAVLNGQVEPSSHPFYTAHRQSFAMIQATSPNLYGALVPNRSGQIRYDTYCQQNGIPCRPNGLDPNRRYRTGTIGDDVASMIEDSQIRRGKETNPRQREALRRVGNVCSVAGCIALGIGILREIFPGKAERERRKKGESRLNRWKVLGLGAGIYGIRHYTQIKDTVLDVFNLDPDSYVARRQSERAREQAQNNMGLSQSEANELVNQKITYPTLVATTIGAIPIKHLIEQKIVEEKNGKLVLNKANYATYIETTALALGRPDKDKQKMLDKLASDEAEIAISYGLSNCGINTLNDLNNLKESEKSTLMDSSTFNSKIGAQIDAIKNKTGIFSNMAKQGFIPVGLDQTIKILEEYDSNKNTNEQILQRLKSGLLKANPDNRIKYNISEMLSSPYVDLMNLDKMTMNGFTNGANEIKFSSYGELFEAVYLTEWIKKNYAGRTDAKSIDPFHINVRGQLEFDNTEWYELHKNEVNIISLREFRNIPTVRDNKQFYVEFLNKWWVSQI